MYLGIDFGTSYSKAALWDSDMNQPQFLLPRGKYGIPSVFYYDQDQGILIGEEAEDSGQGIDAENMKRAVKMDLSHDFTADGRTFTSREIITEIYKKVLAIAEKEASKGGYGTNVQGAVISVPAKFTLQEISLIENAAKDAGIHVTGVIKEPIAAALAYFKKYNRSFSDSAIIYDLGGGTCDIALIEHDEDSKPEYEVIDSDMVRLGGKDWSACLTDYLADDIEDQSGINVRSNISYMEKISRAAEDVKRRLAEPDREETKARVEINGRIYKSEIDLNTFDRITKNLLKQTMDCLHKVYDDNCDDHDITDIICVGGSSNMKQVLETIEDEFPDCDVSLVEPERAVVYGDAIYAAEVKGGNMVSAKNFLRDIAAFSYGTDCLKVYGDPSGGSIIVNLIRKGTALPCNCSHSFSTVRDGQSGVSFDIYESDTKSEECSMEEAGNEPIGRMLLELPPNTPADSDLEMIMKLDNGGMLYAEGRDDNGNKIHTTINLNELKR